MLFFVLLPFSAGAQFYLVGDVPGGTKWSYINSANYKVIYPRGLDSLGRAYAVALEKARPMVGASAGFLPGERYSTRMPVVLHTFSGESNGSVSWAPRQMNLYTLPDADDPESVPWTWSLAVHESRHAAQMQFGASGLFTPFKWLLGEMFAGAMAGVYPDSYFLEGDAVVAETALTSQGRGRSGDFMAYYMAAFAEGDWRDFYRWRYGSFKYGSPDYYALGYMTLSGARWLWDKPLFTASYFKGVARHPFRIFPFRKDIKKASGLKFPTAFASIEKAWADLWASEEAARAPFTLWEDISGDSGWFPRYSSPAPFAGGLLVQKRSKVDAGSLLFVSPDGKRLRMGPVSPYSSDFIPSPDGGVWWRESVPDLRWGMKASTKLNYFSPEGSRKSLSLPGRVFNPVPLDGGGVLAIEYALDGRSSLENISLEGTSRTVYSAPDSLQLSGLALVGEDAIVSGISPAGAAFYRLRGLLKGAPESSSAGSSGESQTGGILLENLTPPAPVSISDLRAYGDSVLFSSDRTGVREIYLLLPDSSAASQVRTIQLTSTRFGASDPAIQGGYLYYNVVRREGSPLVRTPLSGLEDREVSFGDFHRYPVADLLTDQEKELGAFSAEPDTVLSAPKKYSKVLNLFHVHSWAPLWFDPNRLASMSSDILSQEADLGATVLFQNELGNAYGALGYSYHSDNYRLKMRHSGHFQFYWSGWWPVLGLNVDFNDRDAILYRSVREQGSFLSRDVVRGRLSSTPLISAGLEAYLPLNFSSGGWSRGVVPRLDWNISNDMYNKSVAVVKAFDSMGEDDWEFSFAGESPGRNIPMQTLTASVRAHSAMYVPSSRVYPEWGVGVELGYHERVGLSKLFTPATYAYFYAYMPGFAPSHGLKLTAMHQRQHGSGRGENAVDMEPRGFVESPDLGSLLASLAPSQLRMTADYALPFYLWEGSCLFNLCYLRNALFSPHIDALFADWGRGLTGSHSFCSAGFNISLEFSRFFGLSFDTSLGLEFDWNFGSGMKELGEVLTLPKTYIGPVVTVDF